MKALARVFASAAWLASATTGFAGDWDVDGFYAAQQRETAETKDWGGSFYVHPRYWLDSGYGGFGLASQLTLGNGYQVFGGGAWRAGHEWFFEADAGLTYGSLGAGVAVLLQVGKMVGKSAEVSYGLYLPTVGPATFMPYFGMRL